MKSPRNTLSVEAVRNRLRYDAETGLLFWKNSIRKKRWEGKAAGYKRKDGYIIINIEGELCLAHRLVWVLVHGKWPESGVDHINGNPNDNRLVNLREATPPQNHWNHKLLQTNNTSGYRGVSFHRKTKKWVAEVWCRRKKHYLGLFDSKEDASHKVELTRAKLFGQFNRTA